MKFPNPYWADWQKVQMLQRWVLTHCALYYVLDASVVSDNAYDSNAKQLQAMMQAMPQEQLERTKYWYAMHDFESSTGHDLISKLTKKHYDQIMRDANYLSAKQKGE